LRNSASACVGRELDGAAVITDQAAVSAILVALYLPGDTSGVSRLVDALIGPGVVVTGARGAPS
jgi:hypothetical protein